MIRTARLILRPARDSDLAPLHEIFADPRAMRYWDRPAHTDLKETQRFLTHFMTADPATREEYILEYNGRCVGKAGLWKPYELGYILHPDLWGQGLVVEACRAILPRAWTKFPEITVIKAETDPRNTGSNRVLEKLGFVHTHTTEQDFLYGEDEWCDTAHFELLRGA